MAEVTTWRTACEYMLKRDEGVRLKPYTCPAGKLTIGVGRNLDDRGITIEECQALLDNDINACTSAAETLLGAEFFGSLETARQLAIVNMIFQLGTVGFAKFSRTIDAIKRHAWTEAANNARASLWAKQTPERAARVIYMLETGKTPLFYQPIE